MKVLITGASSFTGRHLLKCLESRPLDVFHIVRKSSGLQNEIIWDFQGSLPGNIPSCDVIVHLAASVYFGQDMRIEQYKVNTISTMRLASCAGKMGAHFIFASMAGVHGNSNSPVGKDSTMGPENHYGMSKYIGEEIIKEIVRSYSILRVGGIYGLNGPAHLGLNRAITNAFSKKETPRLNGPGNAKRNYICVRDVAKWIAHLIEQYKHKEKSEEEILYLAGEEICTIKGYLETIVETLLPGEKILSFPGEEGQDMIVLASKPPFTMTPFRNYLLSLTEGGEYARSQESS